MQITRDLNLELHKQELPHTVTQYIPVFRIAPHLETFQQKDHLCWYLKNRGPRLRAKISRKLILLTHSKGSHKRPKP